MVILTAGRLPGLACDTQAVAGQAFRPRAVNLFAVGLADDAMGN